jgi:hypothetical protein
LNKLNNKIVNRAKTKTSIIVSLVILISKKEKKNETKGKISNCSKGLNRIEFKVILKL